MNSTKSKFSAGITMAVAGIFALSACTSSDTMEPEAMDPAPMTSEEPTMDAPVDMSAYDNLVGPACADYDAAVPDGAGSVVGMSQDPVAVAASNNPLLTTLVAAVSGQLNPEVDLVDTLNGSEFTVFAPTDDAFAKIDAETIEVLSTDAELLSAILTYHVIPGQIEPNAIEGSFATVNGAEVTVTGSGDSIMVNGESAVLCGGVQTANATVYLIDTVLLPPTE